MACGTNTLLKYDTEKNDHAMSANWSKYTPVASKVGYDTANNITLNTPSLSCKKYDDTTARIVWSSVPSADQYDIEVYNDLTNKLIGRKTSTKNILKLIKLKNGQSLRIRCRAKRTVDNTVYYSNWNVVKYRHEVEQSAPVTVTVDVPSDLKVISVDTTNATLSWCKVTNVDKYDIELYSDSGCTNRLKAGSSKTNDVVFSDLDSGTTYYVRVRASKTVNGQDYKSDWAFVSFTTDANSKVTQTLGLSHRDITDTSVYITWSSVGDKVVYDVQISDVSDFSNIVASGQVSADTVKVINLKSNTTYHFRVRVAQTNDGVYHDWEQLSFTTRMSSATLGGVTNMSAKKLSSTSTRLLWNAVENATAYDIRVYSDKKRTNLLLSGNVASTNVRLTKLVPGRSYYISVRAVREDGDVVTYSDWYDVVLKK